MTSTEGYWHYLSPVKTIWVGIQYAPEFDLDGLSGVELSIDGLYQLPEVASVNFDVKHNPAVIIGNDIRTPDPSLHRGEGGINAAWNGCVVGDIELIEIVR